MNALSVRLTPDLLKFFPLEQIQKKKSIFIRLKYIYFFLFIFFFVFLFYRLHTVLRLSLISFYSYET